MMKEIEFRIVERKTESGTIYFMPERTVESERSFENYKWVNINFPFIDYNYCATASSYEDALRLIKEFISNHEEPIADKIHELPNLILKYDINEKSLKAEAYRRGFVKDTVFHPYNCQQEIIIENLNNIVYDARNNILFYDMHFLDKYPLYYNGYPIYNDACNSGHWAEIISKENIEETFTSPIYKLLK